MSLLIELQNQNNSIGWPWTEQYNHSNYDGDFVWPKISIITPSYNQGQYIEETIQSVINQNYPNLEYIIIDGGSTDNTLEVIKKYEKWITYWVSEPDKGQSHAINKGIKRATGDIMNWLNSDDFYEPGALKLIAENFKQGVHCVTGRSNIFDNNGLQYHSHGTDIYPNNLAKTIGWARIDQPETFFSRRAWEIIGSLNTQLHYIFDREWWIRYLFHFGLDNIRIIPNTLVNFRHHENSKTVSKFNDFEIENIRMYAKISEYTNKKKISSTLVQHQSSTPSIDISLPTATSITILNSSINYYLLYNLEKCYADNDKQGVKKLSNLIVPQMLAKDDLQRLRKVLFRNMLPLCIIKLTRNIKELITIRQYLI